MKTKAMLFFFLLTTTQLVSAKDQFYFELISNPSKTIDYVIGFYHTNYLISTASDDKEYVAYAGAVINNSSSTLEWEDYCMVVRKKDGGLVFSYVTAATSGEYCTKFVLAGKEKRLTKFCFHDNFKPSDIADVYLMDKSLLRAFQLSLSE